MSRCFVLRMIDMDVVISSGIVYGIQEEEYAGLMNIVYISSIYWQSLLLSIQLKRDEWRKVCSVVRIFFVC